MNTLERLQELAKAATPGPCRVVTLEFDEESGDIRYVVEFPGVKTGSVPEARRLEAGINALPALIAVAEIGDELATAVREWSLELNNTTVNDCAVLAIRYQQALAALEVEE